jgi:hypothetical protein
MDSLCTIFLLAVSLSGARVLAQVLGPGFHDETFDEAPGVRRVVKQTPSDRAVSPSNSSQFPHGLPKSVDLIRINPELGLNEHGPSSSFGSITTTGSGQFTEGTRLKSSPSISL